MYHLIHCLTEIALLLPGDDGNTWKRYLGDIYHQTDLRTDREIFKSLDP
jgi:hypothetical protein